MLAFRVFTYCVPVCRSDGPGRKLVLAFRVFTYCVPVCRSDGPGRKLVLAFRVFTYCVSVCRSDGPGRKLVLAFRVFTYCVSVCRSDGPMLLYQEMDHLMKLLDVTDISHRSALQVAIGTLQEKGVRMPRTLWEYKVGLSLLLLLVVVGLLLQCSPEHCWGHPVHANARSDKCIS